MITSFCGLFAVGFLQVFLVSTNTRQVAQARYPGAFVVGFLISLVWAFGVRSIASSDPWHAVVYATGAACGTVTGIFVTRRVYGV